MKETFTWNANLKMAMMKVLTVKEIVEKLNKGDNLEGFTLDANSIEQVNVRDALVLARAGIVIPEQNIYYNDDEIEYDEDIDELVIANDITNLSWEEKAKRAQEYTEQSRKVVLNLSTQKPEIDDWILKNKERVETLLRPIVINLFNTEKALETKPN